MRTDLKSVPWSNIKPLFYAPSNRNLPRIVRLFKGFCIEQVDALSPYAGINSSSGPKCLDVRIDAYMPVAVIQFKAMPNDTLFIFARAAQAGAYRSP